MFRSKLLITTSSILLSSLAMAQSLQVPDFATIVEVPQPPKSVYSYHPVEPTTFNLENVRISKAVYRSEEDNSNFRALEATVIDNGYPFPGAVYWRTFPANTRTKRYINSLDPSRTYKCEINFSANGSGGNWDVLYADSVSCKAEPIPTPVVVKPTSPDLIPGYCVSEENDNVQGTEPLVLAGYYYKDGKQVLWSYKSKIVNPDFDVSSEGFVNDSSRECGGQVVNVLATVRWISSNTSPEGYVFAEITHQGRDLKIQGLIKLDDSRIVSDALEESRVKGGTVVSIAR